MGCNTPTMDIDPGESVRAHVRAMLEKLKAGRLAERVALVDPGRQISGKREGATLSGSGTSPGGAEIQRNREK